MQDRIRKNQILIHARESPLIKFSSRSNMIETTMKTCDGVATNFLEPWMTQTLSKFIG
jgi:hypothetical protein